MTTASGILERITETAERLEADRLELGRLILQAREAGESLRNIGEAAGLSHETVRQVERLEAAIGTARETIREAGRTARERR